MDALVINALPAVIDTNYEVVKAQLEADIQQYDIVVTADGVKDAKALATQLNKVKNEIAKRRKSEIAKVSGPLKEFEAQVKALEVMCETGRQKILAQVAEFEAIILENIKSSLEATLHRLYHENSIRPEFQEAVFDDLIKMGSFTAKERLTKGALDALTARVEQCDNMQKLAEFEAAAEESRKELAAQVRAQEIIDEKAVKKARDEAEAAKSKEETMAKLGKFGELPPAEQEKVIRSTDVSQHFGRDTEDSIHPHDMGAPGYEPEEEKIYPGVPDPVRQAEIMKPRQTNNPPASGTRPVRISIMLGVNAPVAAPLEAIEAALRKKLAAAGVEKSVMDIQLIEGS